VANPATLCVELVQITALAMGSVKDTRVFVITVLLALIALKFFPVVLRIVRATAVACEPAIQPRQLRLFDVRALRDFLALRVTCLPSSRAP